MSPLTGLGVKVNVGAINMKPLPGFANGLLTAHCLLFEKEL